MLVWYQCINDNRQVGSTIRHMPCYCWVIDPWCGSWRLDSVQLIFGQGYEGHGARGGGRKLFLEEQLCKKEMQVGHCVNFDIEFSKETEGDNCPPPRPTPGVSSQPPEFSLIKHHLPMDLTLILDSQRKHGNEKIQTEDQRYMSFKLANQKTTP